MKLGQKFLPIIFFLVFLAIAVPFSVSAFSLVPCGQTNLATGKIDTPCEFKHLVILIIRLINYLISVAAMVAMYQVLFSGWNLIAALGNEEKIKKAREGISHAVVGFAIIILAFVFVNLLMNGIFGDPNDPNAREWWRPECIWGIGDSASGCPGGISLSTNNPGGSPSPSPSPQPVPPSSPPPSPPTSPTPPNPNGPAPANLRVSPASAFAGVFDKFINGGEAVYKNNDLAIILTGENLEGARLSSNARDLSSGQAVTISNIRVSDNPGTDVVTANFSISPTTQDGGVQFILTNSAGKSATIDFTLQITGTQWLVRQFPKTQKRMTFFGDWTAPAPNGRVQDLANKISQGLGATTSSAYKQLDIWINIYESGFWGNIAGSICSSATSIGCSSSSDNIIENKEDVNLSATILHESGHKLYSYHSGTYRGIPNAPKSPTQFPSSWIAAVGNLSSCQYLPLQNSVTWKNGETNVPHCGFIWAYGASACNNPTEPNCEDVASMTEYAVFYANKFNYPEVKNDTRYKQKLDLLKQYQFINSSPLGHSWIPAFAGMTERGLTESLNFVMIDSFSRRMP